MKISLFLTFLIGSVATVAADEHIKDHDNNKKGMNLRASPGSAAAQGTAFALFDGKLETDSSLMTVDDKTIMTLEKEMEDALKGMNEVERSIQLAAYKDYTENNMSLEEINKKYLPHGDDNLDVGTKTGRIFTCCKRTKLTTEDCYHNDKYRKCKDECFFGQGGCCHPHDKGKQYWWFGTSEKHATGLIHFLLNFVQ